MIDKKKYQHNHSEQKQQKEQQQEPQQEQHHDHARVSREHGQVSHHEEKRSLKEKCARHNM